MRAPNGYGQISKLPGNRRKPWRFRVVVGYRPNANGGLSSVTRDIGYYETKRQAYLAREEYNRQKGEIANSDYVATFEEIYEMWSKERFPELSVSRINAYKTGFKKSTALHKKPIKKITYQELQDMLDASGGGPSTKQSFRTMLKLMWDYAEKRGMVEKNIAAYLNAGKREPSTKHYKFTSEEIHKMWEHKDNEVVAALLLLIYSGMRPGELFALPQKNVDLESKVFRIDHGKNKNAIRTVPIHPDVFPLVEKFMDGKEYLININGSHYNLSSGDHYSFMRAKWRPTLNEIGILNYKHPDTGYRQEHRPHDARHTFTSQWKALQLDESIRRKIQGHAGKDVAEQVYTHYDPEILQKELEKLHF